MFNTAANSQPTEYCTAKLRANGVEARSLYYLTGGRLGLATVRLATERRQLPTKFGYIVPNFEHGSGAIFVKYQHKFLQGSVNTQSESGIELQRNKYDSPCTGASKQAFKAKKTVDEFRRYHFYIQPDLTTDSDVNFDNFHADVGVRPASSLFSRTQCLQTNTAGVREKALFDPERRLATVWERTRWAASTTLFRGDSAQATPAPPVYKEFQQFTVRIIPYTKPTREQICVVIPIERPRDATETILSIVDADDAYARSLLSDPDDGHRTWQINWTSSLRTTGASH
jgi:hypothetical protein